jgi:hypothetical protein
MRTVLDEQYGVEGYQCETGGKPSHRRLSTLLLTVLLTARVWVAAFGQPANTQPPYDAIYCFGFSWTDTRGRYCNGAMWPEYLSTNLGLPYIQANNLAQPGASTAATLAQVEQLRPATNANRGLYVAWVGAGDILSAADANFSGSEIKWTNEVAWTRMLQSVLKTSSNIVERLYVKGARTVVIQNCLDLTLAPMVIRDFGANKERLAKLKERTAGFNSDLALALRTIHEAKPDIRVFVVDVFSLENAVWANPDQYGFSKVFPDVQSDPMLRDRSRNGPGKDYMFWDPLHGTSRLQKLLAEWTEAALTNSPPETVQAAVGDGVLTVRMNHLQIGTGYTLENSSDLKTWKEATTFLASEGTNQWMSAKIDAPQGFYRLKWHQ